jgi:hypothetical protein
MELLVRGAGVELGFGPSFELSFEPSFEVSLELWLGQTGVRLAGIEVSLGALGFGQKA